MVWTDRLGIINAAPVNRPPAFSYVSPLSYLHYPSPLLPASTEGSKMPTLTCSDAMLSPGMYNVQEGRVRMREGKRRMGAGN